MEPGPSRTKGQKSRRAEWWRRTPWALDRALDPGEGTKALGLATLEVLARSGLARTEELELFDIAWKSVSGEENGEDTETDTGPWEEAAGVDGRAILGENETKDEENAEEVGP